MFFDKLMLFYIKTGLKILNFKFKNGLRIYKAKYI